MGECPDWYVLIRAAKYLGVPPWDLLSQPVAWKGWALQAEYAESEAKRQKSNPQAVKGVASGSFS